MAIAPPACAELSGACQVGVCRPESGCVAEPRRVLGAVEREPVQLEPHGFGSAVASSACGSLLPSALSCAPSLAGPSAFFELDLRDASAATSVTLIIDASFAFEAALARGPANDAAVLACGEPFYSDGSSRRLAAQLEPGLFHLIVTGKSAADRGVIHVASAVGELACAAPLQNDACATALAVDSSLDQQTLFVHLGCATPSVPLRCAPSGAYDAFYELDLSARTSDVVLDVDVLELGAYAPGSVSLFDAAASSCVGPLTCGQSWSRVLAPGRYTLGVSAAPDDVQDPFALRIRLDGDGCVTPENDRWEGAIALDPNLPNQRIQGNTACAKDDFSAACNTDRGAPDLFYRLDLRGQSAPRRLRMVGTGAAGVITYVLTESARDVELPGACDDLDGTYILAPRLYYLALDGQVQDAGRFAIDLSLEELYDVPRACFVGVDRSMFEYCLADTEPACTISLAHPDCLRTAVECGLASEVYVNFCAAEPGCCDGTSVPESCEAPWRDATLCPG